MKRLELDSQTFYDITYMIRYIASKYQVINDLNNLSFEKAIILQFDLTVLKF